MTFPQPGTVGFRGDPGTLKVINSAATAPAGTTWAGTNLEVTGSNVVLDGVHVKGGVDFASGGTLTIRNSIIEGGYGGWFTVIARTAGSTLDIRDSTLRWRAGAGQDLGAGAGSIQVYASLRVIALRNDISGMPDGIQLAGDNSRVEGNWIHNLAMIGTYPDNTHNDGIQMYDGAGVVIANNRFETGARSPYSNAAIFVQPGGGNDVTGLRVEGNYLDGGGYTLYLESGQGTNTGVIATNNTFGPNRLWGPARRTGTTTITQWTNNRLSTGATVSTP